MTAEDDCSRTAAPPESGAAATEIDERDRWSAFMSALVTEHFVLQSAASTTIAEAGVRASLYVFSLSSALVAIGFTAQTPDVFAPFVATVIPTVFLLGWFTVVRLVDTGLENVRSLRAIARIRGYYRTLTPEAADYFSPWGVGDETQQALAALAVTPGRLAPLFTIASMVAVVNSLVGGVGVALVTNVLLSDRQGVVAVAVGAVGALTFAAAAYRYQDRRFAADAAGVQPAGAQEGRPPGTRP
jgi:hypothetical protein